MWDLPRPGLEPVSPALAGRFSTTAPPGKPYQLSFDQHLSGVVIITGCLIKIHLSLFLPIEAQFCSGSHLFPFHTAKCLRLVGLRVSAFCFPVGWLLGMRFSVGQNEVCWQEGSLWESILLLSRALVSPATWWRLFLVSPLDLLQLSCYKPKTQHRAETRKEPRSFIQAFA